MSYKAIDWPEVKRKVEELEKLYGKPLLGLDLEWGEDERPTILGLSDGELSVSVPYNEGKRHLVELLRQHPDTVLVGHNIVGSDLFVLEGEGIKLDLEHVEDTIIWYWLTNMHLCKTSKKSSVSGEDEGERRGRGFMNLGSMCSVYTNLPFWKECRGKFCEKIVCPKHDPYGYNGVDSAGPVLALPKLKQTARLRGVDKLYPMHRELAYVLADMSRVGVMTDVPYADSLRAQFTEDKSRLEDEINSRGFNPNSNPQVLAHFKKRGITLDDNTEETIREAVDDNPQDEDLGLLLEYKELGDGIDRWFAPRKRNPKSGEWEGYVYPDGRIHPHLGFYTSSARLMCSNPNLQNVAKRRIDRRHCQCGHGREAHVALGPCGACNDLALCKGFLGESVGKKVRRCIIAPEGYYIIRADYKNAENRNFLYLAGITNIPDEDFHTWMANNIGIDDNHPFSVKMGGRREAAKSVTHGTDYLEGLSLKFPHELKGKKVKQEIEAGARLVFEDWTFNGKVVTFTGINLARRAFGSASLENRRLALDIVKKYFDRFEPIRDLQRRISKQVEEERIVRPPHGYALLSYGYDEDRMKQATAVWGSQPVAHISKVALLDIHRRFRAGRPLYGVLQIHDEIVAYVPNSVEPTQAASWIRESMEVETPEMPGFIIPAEPSFGPDWKNQKKLK